MRKQSAGNPNPSPPDDFVLFLDENLHKCAPILAALDEAGVKYEKHASHFKPGELDSVWLPKVCQEGWIVLTKDKGIRYNQLEIAAVLQFKGREFFFRSGNWSGSQMGEILSKALHKMVLLTKRTPPPFIASLTQAGEVHLRYDKHGSIHDQKRRKHNG